MKRKRLKVVYSDLAGSQLREILAYCRREFGISVERRVRNQFIATEELLSKFHYLFPVIENGSIYRKINTTGKNTIVYRFHPVGTKDSIIIVAVFSAGRNINYSDIAD